MNPQDNKTAGEIRKAFDEIVSIHKLSEDQKKQVFEKLEGSISLNLISRLLDGLSKESKDELQEKGLESEEKLLSFLAQKTPKEALQNAIVQSTDEILTKFLNKI